MATNNPGRKAATAAARALMTDKLKTVEVLATALDAYQASQVEIDRAIERAGEQATAAREAHEEARAAGWTPAELRQIGLEPPTIPRRRRETDPGSDDATPDTRSKTTATEGASSPAPAIDITEPAPAGSDSYIG